MLGELRGDLVRWLRDNAPASVRRVILLQEIADEVQVKAGFSMSESAFITATQ